MEEIQVYGPFISRKQAKEQGLNKYFVAKKCPKGHVSPRRVHNSECIQCASISSNIRCKIYYKNNTELIKKRSIQHRIDNPGMAATSDRQRYKENPEYYRQSQRQNYQENKDRYKDSAERRRRGLDKSFRKLSKTDQQKVNSIYSQRRKLNDELGYIALHVDHLLPIKKGGKHEPDNLLIMTAEANRFWLDRIKKCPWPKPETWDEPNWEY